MLLHFLVLSLQLNAWFSIGDFKSRNVYCTLFCCILKSGVSKAYQASQLLICKMLGLTTVILKYVVKLTLRAVWTYLYYFYSYF